jgi:hypothetical protein
LSKLSNVYMFGLGRAAIFHTQLRDVIDTAVGSLSLRTSLGECFFKLSSCKLTLGKSKAGLLS